MMEPQRRRKRGVPLSDLDRSKAWVIAHTGRRWEVVGPAGSHDRAVAAAEGAPGAGDEVASTGGSPGHHAAPGEGSPEGT